jgi:hypothetical protein
MLLRTIVSPSLRLLEKLTIFNVATTRVPQPGTHEGHEVSIPFGPHAFAVSF